MPYSFLSRLECSRTGTSYDADEVQGVSEVGAPLLARYDLERVRASVTREEIADPATRRCGATTSCCRSATPRTSRPSARG